MAVRSGRNTSTYKLLGTGLPLLVPKIPGLENWQEKLEFYEGDSVLWKVLASTHVPLEVLAEGTWAAFSQKVP